jgi:hypothetical protein
LFFFFFPLFSFCYCISHNSCHFVARNDMSLVVVPWGGTNG